MGVLRPVLSLSDRSLFALITGDRWGIQGLVIAFAVSPFGLPAVAEWLIDKLDSLNYSLKSFITG